MDEEFLLTLLYMLAGASAVLYLLYLVWFMHTTESFRQEPVLAACAWISMVGALLFFSSMASMGQLAFAIATPWGTVQSDWLGALLAVISLAVRHLLAARKRRKRLRRLGGMDGG